MKFPQVPGVFFGNFALNIGLGLCCQQFLPLVLIGISPHN